MSDAILKSKLLTVAPTTWEVKSPENAGSFPDEPEDGQNADPVETTEFSPEALKLMSSRPPASNLPVDPRKLLKPGTHAVTDPGGPYQR